MERTSYSDEMKAAVLAALMAGQSVSEVAREYHLPKGTVSAWKKRMTVAENATQKKEIGELLVEYLKRNLITLKVQAEVFADKAWLKKQPAGELAVLHGVLTDKAVRLLDALSKDDEPGIA